MKHKKIWILGGGGSGKTTFARKLSKKMKIPFYTTDHFIYSINFKRKYSEERRDKELKKVLRKKQWIIEGVHASDWIIPGFEKADLVIILDIGILKRFYRTLKREKKKTREGKKTRLLRLLFWVMIYTIDSKREHKKKIKKYNKEYLRLRNNKEINNYLKTL